MWWAGQDDTNDLAMPGPRIRNVGWHDMHDTTHSNGSCSGWHSPKSLMQPGVACGTRQVALRQLVPHLTNVAMVVIAVAIEERGERPLPQPVAD